MRNQLPRRARTLLGGGTVVHQLPAGVLQVGADEPLELLQLGCLADEEVLGVHNRRSQTADVLDRQSCAAPRQIGQPADLQQAHRPIAVRAHGLQ